ncbi:prolipoprotein diacylglyceryl transferase [Saccharothrix tamanrassetensis]|uniref:prolipoprotein diacylglyceryl transferase n=1 Tax=Saccharothrix tamanrassetensis TaxID=1051531 RepID=UPI0028B016D5|nr:prolipoprotein diacylglyceryl transferase [Saccharothrix tamanrassetensis]
MTTFLATIPSPDQGVWQLGPVPIRAYALCIIAGIIVAIWWGERRWVARGGLKGEVTDIAVFAVPFGLVGGRLYHVATDHQKYFGEGKNPWEAFAIWNGGLGIWGAIALGGVGAWIACRRRGIPLPAMADALAPGIVVAQAIGRLGNYFNQELYGGPTTLPWGLEIYDRVDPATGLKDELNGVALDHTPIDIVHPTFLYELLWNLGVALLIVWADRRFRLGHGRVFALYVAGYTAGRFWIEIMRTDPANQVFGLRINVITSVVVFLGAVVYLALTAKKGDREVIVRGDAEASETGDGATPAGGAASAGGATPAARDSGSADTTGDGTADDRAAGDRTSGERAVGDRTTGDRAVGERTTGDGSSGKPDEVDVKAESRTVPDTKPGDKPD